MADFMIRFALCNVWISGIIVMLLIIKRLLKHILSSRMQYNLWFVLLGLLAVPLLPIRIPGVFSILSWLSTMGLSEAAGAETAIETAANPNVNGHSDWMNDFVLSVHRHTPSAAGYLLLGLWIAGILVMLIRVIHASLRLSSLEKSALPVQNKDVRRLYHCCLEEMRISRNIPIYSTAFLKSPMITGFLKPRIYLPIHLISDYDPSGMRYMLLHELQHYKHKDGASGFFMNLAGIIYWFNPLIRYALKEMQNDKEVACDASVLNMLDEDAYEDYGNTLINFAEKVSRTSFPFASSLGGNMKQMKRRSKNIHGTLLKKNISTINVSEQFGSYTGSFVLYDLESDHWFINDMDQAVTRVAPDSTYKIYDGLFALDAGIISPEDSRIPWDHTDYPFVAWNGDQTLPSALTSSVNWYFQKLDDQLGKTALRSYVETIGYGNEDLRGDLSSYWMESTLKISPVEQAELMAALYQNRLPFAPEHIQTVKDAICLSSASGRTLYGKTGTGRVDDQDIRGWFIGFLETPGHTWIFATHIQADQAAAGSNAAEITLSILSRLHLWE